MANASIEVFDGSKWVPITSESTEKPESCKVTEGTGVPTTETVGKIYINLDSTVAKNSEKIYFNV